jgi:hypothetical protein
MKWNGKDYKPLVPQKIVFKEEKFDVQEYMKSLAEKHDRMPVWRAVPNPIAVNVPVSTGPQPTPSPTSSNTPTPSVTASPTPTITASATPPSTPTPTTTPTPSSTPTTPASGTTEANEFLNRVLTSGGTLNSTISAATQTLFTSIVSNNLWDQIDVFYPIIGGNAQGQMQGAGVRYSNRNNLAFAGGWTHSISGMTPNGVNAGANTGYSPQNSATGGVNTPLCSLGGYINASSYTGALMGAIDAETDIYQIRLRPGSSAIDPQPNTTVAGALSTTLSASTGMYITSRTGSTQTFVLQNSGVTVLSQAQGSFNTLTEVFVGQRNYGPSPEYGNGSIAFVFMGRSLTVPQAQTLRNIVQTFQTALSRNSI